MNSAERLSGAHCGITKVDGQPTLGTKLSITTKANPGRAFPIKIVQLSAPSGWCSLAACPLVPLTGELKHTLVPEGSGTRFTMREKYTGRLAGMNFERIPT